MALRRKYLLPRVDRRLELQAELEGIIGSKAAVYYEPPENINMTYPCIVYTRESIRPDYADNKTYITRTRYQITYIDNEPDSENIDKIMNSIEGVSYGRHFVSDGLHHDTFYTYKY